MSNIPFYSTRMGQKFFESTMPELVRQLTRLNDLLEETLKTAPEQMPSTSIETVSRNIVKAAKTALKE